MIDLTDTFEGILAQIIEPRIEELYSLIAEIVRDSGFEELVSSGDSYDRRNVNASRSC